jgi:hypothetical protein
MKSLKKMADLADRFEFKLSRAQKVTDEIPTQESNQRPVIMDAFFGDAKAGGGEQVFLKQINLPTSNFNTAAGNVQGKISINVQVDAPSKRANFIVKVDPPVKADVLAQITAALVRDYGAAFRGKTPAGQLAERLAKNEVKPPTVSGTTDLVTM